MGTCKYSAWNGIHSIGFAISPRRCMIHVKALDIKEIKSSADKNQMSSFIRIGCFLAFFSYQGLKCWNLEEKIFFGNYFIRSTTKFYHLLSQIRIILSFLYHIWEVYIPTCILPENNRIWLKNRTKNLPNFWWCHMLLVLLLIVFILLQ